MRRIFEGAFCVLLLAALSASAQMQNNPREQSGNFLVRSNLLSHTAFDGDADTMDGKLANHYYDPTNQVVWADYTPKVGIQWVASPAATSVVKRMWVLGTEAGSARFHIVQKHKTNTWNKVRATNLVSVLADSTYLVTNLNIGVSRDYVVGLYTTNATACTNLHVTLEFVRP